MKLRLLLATTLISALACPAPEEKEPSPGDAKPAKEQPAEEGDKDAADKPTYPVYGKVKSLSEDGKTLVLEGKEGERSFALTKNTKVVDGKEESSLDKVKAGNWIGGMARKRERGGDAIMRINVGAKQKEDSDAAGDKPKKDDPDAKKDKPADKEDPQADKPTGEKGDDKKEE